MLSCNHLYACLQSTNNTLKYFKALLVRYISNPFFCFLEIFFFEKLLLSRMVDNNADKMCIVKKFFENYNGKGAMAIYWKHDLI